MPELVRFRHVHLGGVIDLCTAEGWPSFAADRARALRVLTASGVTTMVAIEEERVVGFAQMLSDGELQAYLANVAVERDRRGLGIGRALVMAALQIAGGERIDLLSEEEAVPFYEAFPHIRKPGFRLYPLG